MTFTPHLCISFLLYNPPTTPTCITFTFAAMAFPFVLEEPTENIGMDGKVTPENQRIPDCRATRAKWWDMNRKGKERKVWGDLFLDTSDQAVRSVLSSDVSLGVGV